VKISYQRIARFAIASIVATSALTACATEEKPAPEEEIPHGYVEGAEEIAEAQSRLVVADHHSGALRVVDLVSGQVTDAGAVDGVRGITGDGRFAYVTTATDSLHVTDSGSWKVDHGDHVHYYRADPQDVGQGAAGRRATGVHSDPVVTAVSFADGGVALLDRAKLDAGVVARIADITGNPHPAVAIPYREHLLVTVADPGQELGRGVEIRTRDGRPAGVVTEPCPQQKGEAVTRRGVVFGCADGALLVTEKDGGFSGEKIAYPGFVEESERPARFDHRPSSTTLAARAGANGVWLLDVARKTWSRIDTGPAVAVNTAGEGSPVLVLTDGGELQAFDPATGARTARTALLTAEGAAGVPAPTIQVDTARAYVNNPAGGEIHEIDYNDNLRRARTFTVPGKAGYMVETGR
jgi:hypothetical protein